MKAVITFFGFAVILSGLFVSVLFTLGFRVFKITGNLMSPEFPNQGYLLARKHSSPTRLLNYGTVVMFNSDPTLKKDYLGRVIALPGESVNFSGEIIIPPNHYFIVPDLESPPPNSHPWGTIPETNISYIIYACIYNCRTSPTLLP